MNRPQRYAGTNEEITKIFTGGERLTVRLNVEVPVEIHKT